MKVILNDDKIIVFLNNKNCDEEIEDYLKKILLKLNDIYNVDINDYNDICVYKDSNYGMILELKNKDEDYFFDNLDIKINMFKINYFLYEIDYNYIDKFKNYNLIKYKNKFYIKVDENLDFNEILEYSNIIYGEDVIKIENNGKKVNYEKKCCSVSWKT